MRRTIIDVSVEDVEKRRVPSKHYVYVIYVTWSDATVSVIYRRYSRFFELQSNLLDQFPSEGGSDDPGDRVIPFLPGKILLGRSHIEKVARKRLHAINEYCKGLVKQPVHISECDLVLQFFEATQEDLFPVAQRSSKKVKGDKISDPLLLEQYVAVADYSKDARNEVALTAGQNVEVIEKTETGWWFVHTDEDQGWAPSSYLEKQDGTKDARLVRKSLPGQEEYYMCLEPYSPEFDDEIRLDKGAMVEVLERNLDGWWLVRCNGREGRAPATNLTRASTLLRQRLQGRQASCPVEKVPNLMSMSNIHLQNFERSDPTRVTICAPADFREPKRKSLDDASTFRRTHSDRAMSRPRLSIQIPSTRVPPAGDLVSSPLEEEPGEDDSEYQRCPPPRRDSFVEMEEVPKKDLDYHEYESLDLEDEVKPRPPRPAPPKVQPKYYAVADFENQAGDGVNLKEGQELQILQKTSTGWWFVRAGTQEGWAPASYIEEKTVPIQRSTKSCHQLSTISAVPSSSTGPQKDPEHSKKRLQSVSESSAVEPGPSKQNIMSELSSKLSHSAETGKGKMTKSKSDSTGIQGQARPVVPSDKPAKVTFSKPLPIPVAKAPEPAFSKPRAPSPITPTSGSEDSSSPDDVREYFNVNEAVRVSSLFYIVKETYRAVDDGEISLEKGEEIEVTIKNETGWWYARTDEKEGWAPSAYLNPKVLTVPLRRSSSTKVDRASLPAPPPPPKQKPNIAELKAAVEHQTEEDKSSSENSKPQISNKKPNLPAKPKPKTEAKPVVPSSGKALNKTGKPVLPSSGKKVNNRIISSNEIGSGSSSTSGDRFGNKKPSVIDKQGGRTGNKVGDKQGVQALAKMFDR